MGLKPCKKCGGGMAPNAASCPHCDGRSSDSDWTTSFIKTWVIRPWIEFLGAMLIGILILLFLLWLI